MVIDPITEKKPTKLPEFFGIHFLLFRVLYTIEHNPDKNNRIMAQNIKMVFINAQLTHVYFQLHTP